MPLHEVGYRSWEGERSSRSLRWTVVALNGIRLVWRGTWIRRTFLFTWLPVIALAVGFILFEQSLVNSQIQPVVAGALTEMFQAPELAEQYLKEPGAVRERVWAGLLLAFFRSPQAIAIVLLIGVIAPRLISYDLRSRGYLLYFSRPLTPFAYILGKSAIVWFYVALITTIPALLMYGLGILMATEWRVVFDTWTLPLRILLASIILIIPTTSVAIAYSSLTLESRYATFAWIATWVLGWVSYVVLSMFTLQAELLHPSRAEVSSVSATERVEVAQRRGPPRMRGRRFESPFANEAAVRAFSRWQIISPYHLLARVQIWIFGFDREDDDSVVPYAVVLAGATIAGWLTVFWRIRGRLRI